MIIGKVLSAISILNVMMTIINPMSYKEEHLMINNRPQTVYTLSIDTTNPNVAFKNVLSYDVLFGFDKTSNMVQKCQALFGVNGMFYDEYGMPYGILIMEGKMVSMNSIGTPTVTITEEGQVNLEVINIKGKVIGEQDTIQLGGTNKGVLEGEWVLFDKIYGDTTRVHRKSLNYLIQDNQVIKVVATNQPVSLEESDYVLTQVTEDPTPMFSEGEKVDIQFDMENHEENEIVEAFQTGGWLVKDGKNIAKEYEPFIGFTTGLNPRTLIGITKDHKLILKVIDGRIPGVSLGVSGYEAAQMMVNEGCIYAAYLDGGASSTMIINGKLVNNQAKGEERAVAHALVFKVKTLFNNNFMKK